MANHRRPGTNTPPKRCCSRLTHNQMTEKAFPRSKQLAPTVASRTPPPPTTVPLVTSRFTLKSGATWTLRFRLPSVLAAWPHAMPSPARRDAAFYARRKRAGTKSSPRRSRLFPSRPLSETQCGSASQMVREARRGPESQSGL